MYKIVSTIRQLLD